MYICGCVCGCACGGVFLFLNFNFILNVNVRNDLIKKILKKKIGNSKVTRVTGKDKRADK